MATRRTCVSAVRRGGGGKGYRIVLRDVVRTVPSPVVVIRECLHDLESRRHHDVRFDSRRETRRDGTHGLASFRRHDELIVRNEFVFAEHNLLNLLRRASVQNKDSLRGFVTRRRWHVQLERPPGIGFADEKRDDARFEESRWDPRHNSKLSSSPEELAHLNLGRVRQKSVALLDRRIERRGGFCALSQRGQIVADNVQEASANVQRHRRTVRRGPLALYKEILVRVAGKSRARR